MTEIGVDTLKKKYNYLTSTSIKHLLLVLTSCILLFSLIACQNSDENLYSNSKNMQWEVVDSEEDFEDEYSQDTTIYFEEYEDETEVEVDLNSYDFTLTFAGDINFADNSTTMDYYNSTPNGIADCISPELIKIMNDADIMCLNNEFTYSTTGSPLNGKAYTFRAHPSRVDILKEMGVDIVTLANNHVFDYGETSFLDTLDTLKSADILYYGAGKNLDEAISPVYFDIQGKTLAYVAASRAEKYKMTPQATEDSPGILRCYDTQLFIETIEEASKNADYVIAYVHWGTEYSFELEDVQLSTGRDYLDAGADIVIGAHPHCLQGMEYYNGKPIVYSLGNLWFNNKTLDTMLLNIHFSGDDTTENIDLEIVPAIQSELVTRIVTEETEKERIYSFLEEISINININAEGMITEVE